MIIVPDRANEMIRKAHKTVTSAADWLVLLDDENRCELVNGVFHRMSLACHECDGRKRSVNEVFEIDA